MEKIQVEQFPWTDPVDDFLAVSAGSDLSIIKDEVLKNQAQLWRCQSDKNLAYVVTRIEFKELVIVLFEGSGIDEFMPLFINRATELNLTIRAHVKRKGLLKMGRKLGFELAEYVIRFNHG